MLPLTMDKKAVAGNEGQNGLFASAVWDEPSQSYIVKVVNTSAEAQPLKLTFQGLKKNVSLAEGTVTTFHSDHLDAENTLDAPFSIVPQETAVQAEGAVLTTEIGAKTFAVYKVVKK